MGGELTAWTLAALQALLFIITAPLLAGWLKRVRCHMQNRGAPPLWQPYRDLAKLIGKKVVLAENASWLFRAVPYIAFGATLLAAAVVPLLALHLPTAALADAIVMVAFLALARFFTALAALDVGTAFGGMGASREMMVSALAEPTMLMALFTLSMTANSTNLSVASDHVLQTGLVLRPSFFFALFALAMVAVAETGRIPIDNPATHLELTMLHEAMILEYSARHLALIEWASSLKLFAYLTLGIALFVPHGIAEVGNWAGLPLAIAGLLLKLMLAGAGLALLETLSAKMRIFRAPEFLGTAFLLAVLGLLIHFLLGA